MTEGGRRVTEESFARWTFYLTWSDEDFACQDLERVPQCFERHHQTGKRIREILGRSERLVQ